MDPTLRFLVRSGDPATSHAAAARVRPTLSQTQTLVLAAIAGAGSRGLTDTELEALPQFGAFRLTTARKRRTELAREGYVLPAGTRDRMTVWVAARVQTPEPVLTTTITLDNTR